MSRVAPLILVALTLAGCARFPAVYSAAALAADSRDTPGSALVHYLAQEDASVEVCHLEGPGDHLRRMDEEGLELLVEGLAEDRVRPDRWGECAAILVREISPASADGLFEPAGQLAVDLAERYVERADGRTLAKLHAIYDLFAGRPEGMPVSQLIGRELYPRLRRIAGKGGAAAELAAGWLRTLDIEQGRLDGEPIAAGRIEALADQDLLKELARRLADASLRELARRRIIRLRIADSAYAIVRERAAAVEEQVLATGYYAVALNQNRAQSVKLEAGREPLVIARQSPWSGAGTLEISRAGEIIDGLPLSGILEVQLAGIDRPVTVCELSAELDPTPCLEPDVLTVEDRFARLDQQGRIRLAADLDETDLRDLATRTELAFELRIKWAPQIACRPRWPLVFGRPDDIVLIGSTGGPGPELAVEMAPISDRRHHFAVRAVTGETLAAYVETADLGSFRILSAGGPGRGGARGAPGRDGAPGSNGSGATCPSGTGGSGGRGFDGSAGGRGEPGGPGGNGGPVTVRIHCSDDCHALVAVLKRTMRSEAGLGGEGGDGGPGGRGGRGGSGGSGTSCYVNGQSKSVSGGSAGSPGSDGATGPKGPRGAHGVPGQVTLKVLRRK